MFVEETVRTNDDRVLQILDGRTPAALRGWLSEIEEKTTTSTASATAPETMQVGRFACLVEDAAHALERLHEAYSQAGMTGSAS